MAHFHPLRIDEIRQETADCISVSFELPDELADTFVFRQGQHLTLRAWINGKEIRRSYSLCSCPLDGGLRVAIKRIPDGIFSSYAHEELGVGDVVEVMPPMGRFTTDLDPAQSKHYVAFAAGSGITPIMSIMQTVLRTEPDSRFSLFYGNRYVSSIIFREEIEGLKNQYMDRLLVYHFLTREQLDAPLFNGRFSPEKIQEIFAKLLAVHQVDEFFLCGPEEMIRTIEQQLLQKKVDRKIIHKELFVASTPKKSQKRRQTTTNTNSCEVVVKDGGKQFQFHWKEESENLLDAALVYGADLPYACKGGVCCTCKAKLLEGEVEMAVNYALEAEEVDAGYILTCQSRPLTDKVVVDYDQAI